MSFYPIPMPKFISGFVLQARFVQIIDGKVYDFKLIEIDYVKEYEDVIAMAWKALEKKTGSTWNRKNNHRLESIQFVAK